MTHKPIWDHPVEFRRQHCLIDRVMVRAQQVTRILIPWVTIVLIAVGTVSPEYMGLLTEIHETGSEL